MRRRFETLPGLPLAALAVLALFGTSATEGAGIESRNGLAVDGSERTVVHIPTGAPVEDYENIGYRLHREGDTAVVEVDVSPLRSEAAAPSPVAMGVGADPVDRLARRLVIGSRSQFEAVSRLLSWVARNVRYELDRGAPQGAEDVLERRLGYCTGIARLSVALMESVGLQAREVPGFLVAEGGATDGGYHRWIEIYYPDRGWVFSDPLSSHHFVPATYLRLAGERIGVEAASETGYGLIEEHEAGIVVADVHPQAPPGVLARRNLDRQIASTLTVITARDVDAVAVLRAGRHEWRRSLDRGAAVFVGLEAGEYGVTLLLDSGARLRQRVELASRSRRRVELVVATRGESEQATDAPRRALR